MQTMATRLAILVGLVAGATGLAEAGSVAYDISWQFGPDLMDSTGPLAGGSFQGTFSATGLPVPSGSGVSVDSFDIVLRNSQGQPLYELTNTSFAGQLLGDPYSVGVAILNFELQSNPLSLALDLDFAAPFNGVGSVIPHTELSPNHNLYSAVILQTGPDTSEFASVSSGTSVLAATGAVPEPSSLMLLGIGGFLLLALVLRRRIAGSFAS